MKNFLSAAILALIVVFSAHCSAYSYDDDPDYVFVAQHGQGTVYLYLPSVDVQEYNPPHYQIEGKFIHVSGMPSNLGKTRTYYATKRFNWYTKETFHRNKYGNWEKNTTIFEKQTANALFRAAYGMKFYSN